MSIETWYIMSKSHKMEQVSSRGRGILSLTKRSRGDIMPRRKRKNLKAPDISADPEQQLCPLFDQVSINKSRVASREDMGMRVLDNCAEEHRQ